MTVKSTFRGTKLQPSVDVYSLAKTLLNGGAPTEVRRYLLSLLGGGRGGGGIDINQPSHRTL